jgi:hypothetical protein
VQPKTRAPKLSSKRKKAPKLSEVTSADGSANGEEVRPAKITAENIKALEELKTKAEGGDKAALKALLEVVTNFGMWRQSKDRQKAVASECKGLIEQEDESVKEAIESPIPIGSTQETFDATRTKLTVIEQRWQEREETKEAVKLKKRDAKKALDAWADKLDRSIQESAQLTLGF